MNRKSTREDVGIYAQADLLLHRPIEFSHANLGREEALRRRVFRMARPRMWERLKYCLDKEGRYHPERAEEFRRVRGEWRGTDREVWLEPHPILATLWRMVASGDTCCSDAL